MINVIPRTKKAIASARKKAFYVWRTASLFGERAESLLGAGLIFHNDGKPLFTNLFNFQIRIWQYRTGSYKLKVCVQYDSRTFGVKVCLVLMVL